MSTRYGRRIDDSQRECINALRAMGCTVEAIQGATGCPDLLCGVFGITELVEVKPVTGITRRRELRESQVAWHQRWKGRPPLVVRNLEDCVALVARMRGQLVGKETP